MLTCVFFIIDIAYTANDILHKLYSKIATSFLYRIVSRDENALLKREWLPFTRSIFTRSTWHEINSNFLELKDMLQQHMQLN